MSSQNLLKILLLVLVAFALGEIAFTLQRYGLPKIDLFKPKPGSCKILEEKYCSKFKIVKHNNNIYLGFEPSTRTPIFSFIDGQSTVIEKIASETSPFKGATSLSIYTPDRSTVATFIGRISLPESHAIKKGQPVGSIAQGESKIFQEFDLLFTADDKTLKALFSKIL